LDLWLASASRTWEGRYRVSLDVALAGGPISCRCRGRAATLENTEFVRG
jgi:hypothetical protein